MQQLQLMLRAQHAFQTLASSAPTDALNQESSLVSPGVEIEELHYIIHFLTQPTWSHIFSMIRATDIGKLAKAKKTGQVLSGVVRNAKGTSRVLNFL